MSDLNPNPETRIALFQRKEIRRTIHNNEWWFVVVDVVAALSDAADPTDYLNKVRRRDPELAKGYGQIVHPLSIATAGGPQNLNCANTEGLFRIIQSIPSPKAEPFKRWLAKVGYERIQEIEDPELATKRTRALYKAKGYSDDWIEKRMRSIAIRDELTGEWKRRGVKEQRDYAILTAEISQAAFPAADKTRTAIQSALTGFEANRSPPPRVRLSGNPADDAKHYQLTDAVLSIGQAFALQGAWQKRITDLKNEIRGRPFRHQRQPPARCRR